jgi:hypothetical protein
MLAVSPIGCNLRSMAVARALLPPWVRIDTQKWTCHAAAMPDRVKRTYNLEADTVQRVREMAERYGVASSQDAVIELAVDELERRLRETREADAWEAAAGDPGFAAESSEVHSAYRSADRETWPA